MSHFRKNCIDRQRVVGMFSAIPHPVAIEVAAQAQPDFLCIDWEHSQIGRERIEDLIRAADLHRVPAMVRVPGQTPEAIAAVLDAGAKGVLVPRVSNAAQARAAVMATRYPPVGERGVGPGRAAAYGYRIPDYLTKANDEILLAIQIETAEGLANVAEIAAVDGIDVLFIGPGDLSVSIGAFGPDGKATLDKAIGDITRAGLEAGRTVGLFRASTADIADWSATGISFFILASDTMFLGAAVAAEMAQARKSMAQTGGTERK
ncbi:HpcH/HpaI aldolase family protein [Rhizobium sp. RAF56]|uniref:HpcH/HpaI aldolase family protein n=1 Tax=Rhizobium sp. RAF56 TaxID=3233062 RepID=UPI003F9C6D9D